MSTFSNWIHRRAENAQWIHQDKKSRIKFKNLYLLIMLACLFGFLVSITLFYFWGLRFDENKPNPYDNPPRGHIAFLISGVILFAIMCVVTCLVGGIYFPMVYKISREIYMHSDAYLQQVKKYNDEDLTKYKKKDLLWLKKLGWISKTDYDITLTKIKKVNGGK